MTSHEGRARPTPNRTQGRDRRLPASGARQGGERGASEARAARPSASNNPGTQLAAEGDTPEKLCQFTLSMRESLHRELAMLAVAEGMTMRGFIMQALRDMGLDVRDQDLVDRRRR